MRKVEAARTSEAKRSAEGREKRRRGSRRSRGNPKTMQMKRRECRPLCLAAAGATKPTGSGADSSSQLGGLSWSPGLGLICGFGAVRRLEAKLEVPNLQTGAASLNCRPFFWPRTRTSSSWSSSPPLPPKTTTTNDNNSFQMGLALLWPPIGLRPSRANHFALGANVHLRDFRRKQTTNINQIKSPESKL